eukprot:8383656-Karenia_brevis.AAC.1
MGLKNKRATPDCARVLDPEVDWFCWRIADHVRAKCEVALTRAKSGLLGKWANTSGLLRFARQCLGESVWSPIVTDKDGGFCLVNRE